MGQKAFISDADAALADRIWNCIEDNSELKNLISSREQISFSPPKNGKFQGVAKLSIFLYSVTQEAAPNTPQAEDASKRNAEPSFALHYLVTPSTGDDKDDHALLEEVINSVLTKPPVGGAGRENNSELSVRLGSLSSDELSRLWTALGTPLRLSVSLTVFVTEPCYGSQAQVTSASVTPESTVVETGQVTQLYQAVLKNFNEQSNDWRSRNMLLKQWVFNDFKKNAGMSVDEMQNVLSSLGSKLEQHGSAVEFIKPLNLLAGYYKHQLEELKGLHKVSHGQHENLETVNTWIKNVNALVEALGA